VVPVLWVPISPGTLEHREFFLEGFPPNFGILFQPTRLDARTFPWTACGEISPGRWDPPIQALGVPICPRKLWDTTGGQIPSLKVFPTKLGEFSSTTKGRTKRELLLWHTFKQSSPEVGAIGIHGFLGRHPIPPGGPFCGTHRGDKLPSSSKGVPPHTRLKTSFKPGGTPPGGHSTF